MIGAEPDGAASSVMIEGAEEAEGFLRFLEDGAEDDDFLHLSWDRSLAWRSLMFAVASFFFDPSAPGSG